MEKRGKSKNNPLLKSLLTPLAAAAFLALWQLFTSLCGQPMLHGGDVSVWALALVCDPAFWLAVFFSAFSLIAGWTRRIARVACIAAFWFTVWQAAAVAVGKPLLMPSPAETFSALGGLAVQSHFWVSIGATFYRVVVGIAISLVSGVLLALVASRSEALQSLLRPVVAAVKSTPVVSIIVLALVWFSSSTVPIVSCVLLCFPIFFANTLAGIQGVDKELLELAAVFRVRKSRVLREIVVPSVMPGIYSALSICLGFSWKSIVAAEVLSSPKYSLGYELYKTKLYLETPELFAWTLAIIVISLAVEKGLKRLLPKGNAL